MSQIKNFREQIRKAFHLLTTREQKVLILRFGLNDGILRTLEEVGREFGVTRDRIRQIEARALEKIRHYKQKEKTGSTNY